MSAALIIYLADISQSLRWVFMFLAILSFIGTLGVASNDDIKQDDKRKALKEALYVFLLCTFLRIVTPASDTVYLMASAKITQDMVTSPEAKQIGEKMLAVINQKLDEQIEKKEK